MKSIRLQDLPVGPLALICTLVVYVAAILDAPQDVVPKPAVVIGALR